MNVLGKRHGVGLQHISVLLRVAWEQRQRQNPADETQRQDNNGNKREHFEALRFRGIRVELAVARLVTAGTRTEEQEERQQDEDGEEHPRIDAVHADGWMEPPVSRKQDDYSQHNGQRQRAL